ncbi:ATP-binding cassette domain-containing protein [Thomasclavelia saccharogumia]|uniref:ABC transporter ATP-binding protein n=1 Tax=Thomasclavelia saccharogumia TaxID=341225 RepID=UPI00047CB96F|nr:ATP-binding cassette domain-containing protein [Thomasclavelia saccharogumia]
MLKVENLTKTFKKINAVENVSFEVDQGEIIGLLGENGAGKTTTLRMIATMLKPTSGNAFIDEDNIIDNPNKIREKIGILFGGDVALYDRLTGRENMTYFAKLNGMSDEEAANAVDQISHDLEMVDYIDRPVGKYSRGMKQKVSLARSIIHHPDVMLFDEPTTGLDVMSSKLIHDFILKCKKENKAIVFSSHNMYETEKLCDRIIIIHKGKIVASGTIDQLKKDYQKDNLEELFIECIGGESNE